MKKERLLKGHGIGKGIIEGEAVVTRQCVSNDNLTTGIYTEKNHELDGSEVKGKILVFPAGKGASFVAHSLMAAKKNGTAPVAMIFDRVTVPQVDSVLLAEIPAVYGFNENATDVIETGDRVRLDAETGAVEII